MKKKLFVKTNGSIIEKNLAQKVRQNKGTYLSQSDVPAYSFDDALRVAKAISEHYASKPTAPIRVASALEMHPTSSTFRMLTGASIAYGITIGGAQAPHIEITPLGARILRPLKENDDFKAKREALLTPRVIGEFLKQYNKSPIPREDIAINVLTDMGVPREKAAKVFALIRDGARSVSFIQTIKEKEYVVLEGIEEDVVEAPSSEPDQILLPAIEKEATVVETPTPTDHAIPESTNKRVFITHGKNKEFIEPIKKLITFGSMEPVVSVDRQSVSQPVPDKVMADMRACGAAIIHVESETILTDPDGKNVPVINPNVLIEIGAAMALYGRRFVLLIRDEVTLPSNLQGLYEVRYKGDKLDSDATIRLLEAINDIKNHNLPVGTPVPRPISTATLTASRS